MHCGGVSPEYVERKLRCCRQCLQALVGNVGEASYNAGTRVLGRQMTHVSISCQIDLLFRAVRCEREWSLRRAREPPAGRPDVVFSIQSSGHALVYHRGVLGL